MQKIRISIYSLLILVFCAHPLLASSITNEGEKAVKITGKTASGIQGSLTIKSGQTLPFRQKFLWIAHVQEGPAQDIRLKISNDNGTTGYITSAGGRYVFPEAMEEPNAIAPNTAKKLRPGYATNSSNVQMYLTMTNRSGSRKTQVLMPNQTVTVPEDIVEIKTEPFNSSFGDQIIMVEIIMPDSKRHTIRSTKATVQLSPDAR